MTVEENRKLVAGPVLYPLDQPVGIHGHEDAGGVLEGEPVGAHPDELLRILHPPVEGVDRAYGVVHLDMGFAAVVLHGLQGHLQVPEVVRGLEDPEDVHAIDAGPLAELLDYGV